MTNLAAVGVFLLVTFVKNFVIFPLFGAIGGAVGAVIFRMAAPIQR